MPVVIRPLRFARNHLFVHLPEGLFLVDTGSPATFGDVGTATLDDRPVAIPRSAMGTSMAAVRTLAGPDCMGLLGMDLLGRSAFRLDGPGATLTTGLAHIVAAGAGVGVLGTRSLASIPVWSVRIGGVACDAVFDTGAQYGYVVDEDLVDRGVPFGEFDDFHPHLGAFRSRGATLDVDLGGVVVRERFGLAPPLLVQQLEPVRVGAVIGCSWLRDVVVDVDNRACRVTRIRAPHVA